MVLLHGLWFYILLPAAQAGGRRRGIISRDRWLHAWLSIRQSCCFLFCFYANDFFFSDTELARCQKQRSFTSSVPRQMCAVVSVATHAHQDQVGLRSLTLTSFLSTLYVHTSRSSFLLCPLSLVHISTLSLNTPLPVMSALWAIISITGSLSSPKLAITFHILHSISSLTFVIFNISINVTEIDF